MGIKTSQISFYPNLAEILFKLLTAMFLTTVSSIEAKFSKKLLKLVVKQKY
jgi:hypothetical protein